MNQREYFRVNLTTACAVRLRKLRDKSLSPMDAFEASTQDISGGGLSMRTDRELVVNDMLTWQFTITLKGQTIDVYGHFVWMKREGHAYVYGVKFIFFDENSRRSLLRTLQLMQARSRFQSSQTQSQ
ncbi:MAG: PilZ protein [Bacilli bacterium]|nr:PilZ protein [Bacilli bacterium]